MYSAQGLESVQTGIDAARLVILRALGFILGAVWLTYVLGAGVGGQPGAVRAACGRQQPGGRALVVARELGAAGGLCAAPGWNRGLRAGAPQLLVLCVFTLPPPCNFS